MNVIDIGSNSVRLLSNGKKTVITTCLAKDMAFDALSPDSIKRTIDAIKTLSCLANGKCVAFATEAVRKASNKNEFIRDVYLATGIETHVLSGDEEAEISYLGASMDYGDNVAVIDLGGASCEIVFGNDGRINYKRSFPFGCVLLADKFGTDAESIKKYVCSLLCDLPDLKAKRYVAVGGTATSISAAVMGLETYDPKKVHGYELSLTKTENFIKEIFEGKDFRVVSPMRKKTIFQGGVALCTVMNLLGQNELIVSEKDNLEGYAIKFC